MSKLTEIHAIASRADLSLTERHARVRAVDPTAALAFAQMNHAGLALELRTANAAAAKAQADADAKARIDAPASALRTYEAVAKQDSVGASIFHRSHFAEIAAEREARAKAAELDPEPDAA